jgi:hypothetical protein
VNWKAFFVTKADVEYLISKQFLLWRKKMKTNESMVDRIIRDIGGLVLLALYFSNTITGTLGIVLAVVGAIALLTGLVGFCPLYSLLKIQTNK